MSTIPELTLRGGVQIPQFGLGTYKVTPEEAERVVSTALELGYRHIDTAAMYRNEREVGRAIAASGLPREELFVTSKLDNPFHDPDAVGPAFLRSLDDLGLDHLDLYLIHWPLARSTDLVATWEAVAALTETGRVRAVGVSNYTEAHLRTIIDATGVTPAVNQIEVHPYLSQEPLRARHREWGIVTQAWSPLARGRVLADAAVVALARRLGCTPSQAVLRWHLERGDVTFPKSSHRDRMVENLGCITIPWDAEATATIDALNRDERAGSHPDHVELDWRPGGGR